VSSHDITDFVDHSKQHFEEGLIRAGYVERDDLWQGTVDHASGHTEVIITLPPRFPFRPPRVAPVDSDAVPWSWHRELGGALCLVADDDHQDLWWTEASVFLDHVAAWFESSDAGWVDDRPDLDLDRYFLPAKDERVYLYSDLGEYRNAFVRFASDPNNVMTLKGLGTRPAKQSKTRRRDEFGYVAVLGDLGSPPRNWEDIVATINPTVNLERQVREHKVRILVLVYNRGEHEGATVLEVWPTTKGGIEVRRLRSGANTSAARMARSGRQSVELGSYHVAVVGVGALGSFIADMLVRAGIGTLTLVDDDVVMPGNLVRHLVGPEAVGLPKSIAVKNHLVKVHGFDSSRIDANSQAVTTSEAATELVKDHDLVMNATADFGVTALFHVVAKALGKSFLSAAMQNSGDTFRVDVVPPLDDAPTLADSSVRSESTDGEYFESGCGSPVSPTPPHAVIEAAAASVRHAIGLLLKQPFDPSGEVRHLAPGTTIVK
jgi:hypothetical protein